MLLLGVLLALLIALIFGGKIRHIETASFSAPWLPVAAVIVEYAAKAVAADWLCAAAVCASYAAVAAFIFLNRQYKKTALALGAGSLCNFSVIALNGFRMPVSPVAQGYLSPEALQKLLSGGIPMYAAQTADTRLPFLGDILCLPAFGLASVGDVFLVIGAALWIFAAMKPRLPRFLTDG